MKTKEKKNILPKGFLSVNGYPTFVAVISFFIYLKNLPKGWNELNLYEPAIQKVRDYWGWKHNTGFGTMFHWGISLGCSKSRTSDERYQAMSIAYQIAKGMIGEGVVYNEIRLPQVSTKEKPVINKRNWTVTFVKNNQFLSV